ncbi:hypothetical protein [Ferruginibacter profundus]
MSDILLYQFRCEINSFKRSLNFLMEENIFFKDRLSQILKSNVNKKMLEKLEVFQSRFITEDELIGLLRNDVADVETLLHRQELSHDDPDSDEIGKMIRKLSYNTENIEKQFLKLKYEFNSFLLENAAAAK